MTQTNIMAIIIAVIITALVVGGGVYFWLGNIVVDETTAPAAIDTEGDTEEEMEDEMVAEDLGDETMLRKGAIMTEDEIEGAMELTKDEGEVVIDDRIYVNNNLGFTLEFPEAWYGYHTYYSTDGVGFGFLTEDKPTRAEYLFFVSCMSHSEWDELDDVQSAFYQSRYLGENDKCVFIGEASQSPTDDDFIDARRMEVSSIIGTFEIR